MKVLHVHKMSGVGGSEGICSRFSPRSAQARPRRPLPRARGGEQRRAAVLRGARGRGRSVRSRPVRLDVSPRLGAPSRVPSALNSPTCSIRTSSTATSTARSRRRRCACPLVSSRHNDDRYLLGPFRYVDRAFARPARRIIAISDAVRHFLEQAGHPAEAGHDPLRPRRTACRPVGATPADMGEPASAPLILAIGRLIAQKDHPTLLRAFARARDHSPDARLAILGSGPLEQETRALAASLGLGSPCSSPAGARFATGSSARASSRIRRGGKASASCSSRRCSPASGRRHPRQRRPGGCRRRRDRDPRSRRRRRGCRSCARTPTRRPRAGAGARRRRPGTCARGVLGRRMTERTIDVYRSALLGRRGRRA